MTHGAEGPTPRGGDPQLDAAAALIEHVRLKMIPVLCSKPERAPRQYAAAALARCNRLLAAMFLLRDGDFPDIIGVLFRSLLECWYLGMYFLLAPEEASEKANAAHVHQLGKLDETKWGDIGAVIEQMEIEEPKALAWDQVAIRVGKLLDESGDIGARTTAEGLYEVIYRGESMMSVHGGLGTLNGHIETGAESLSLRETRLEPDDGGLRIRLGAPLLEALARAVAGEFGLSRTEIDRLGALLADESPE